MRNALIAAAILLAAAASGQSQERPEMQALADSLNGQKLFRSYCVSCHGVNGKGSGPAAAALKTPPPDLTKITQRNRGTFPFDLVQKIINGEAQSGAAHGSREMPVWGPIFSQIAWDQDLGKIRTYNLAKYLESIQAK
jgi:mono/diheme cytochrome c family protein